MEIDYKAIGNRIRRIRNKKGMTQDDLRFKINISKTHMSHIETGSTKLSLPVLVDIANALDTSIDFLMSDSINASNHIFNKEIEDVISDCSPYELSSLVKSITLIKSLLRNLPRNIDLES